MAWTRSIARPLACHNCQQWILRSFIASVAGQSPLQHPATSHRRTFVRSSNQLHALREETIQGHALNDGYSDTPSQPSEPVPAPQSQPQTSNSQLPWYLQVQQPLPQPASPLSDRQKLPDLPVHPPDLLQPILEHVSVDLGMDDLSLLDMRTLDPPAALGANLLMIVGTARSEKHLHVSADRLCRWLRTEYKLSPYADGLLGRNELKLKLRRKAKRTRLLSAVGAKETAQTEIDDGIRTGWVCVNIGRVSGGELPDEQHNVQDREGVIGFGSITGGSSIVIQLMTEEKRGEIDLEKLWTDALRRSDKRRQKLLETEQEAEGESTVDGDIEVTSWAEHTIDQSSASQRPTTSSNPDHYTPFTVPGQLRAYHTSARRNAATAPINAASTPSFPATYVVSPSVRALERHISSLKGMDTKRALGILGRDILQASARLDLDDNENVDQIEPAPTRSVFLDRFYGSMPIFPGPEHYHLHFELLACARQLGHSQLHSPVFYTQLKRMQIAGFIPEEKTFKLILRTVLSPLGHCSTPYDGDMTFPSQGKMHLVLSILEDMEACGYDPMTAEILELLHQACLGRRLNPLQMQQLQSMPPALRIARLRRHVRDNDWHAFWRTWHAYPRHFLPRTSDMYAVLFEAIADGKTRNVQEARNAMEISLPEMEMEEPRVALDLPLAQALLRALEYVEPEVQATDGVQSSTVSREWRALYEKCRRLLPEGTEEEKSVG